jgi:carbonic anhydrase
MRAAWALLLLGVNAGPGGALLRKALLNGRTEFPRFETLEECEEAYNKLLGGDPQGNVVVEPNYVEEKEPKKEPKKGRNAKPEPEPTAAPAPKPVKVKPVGEPVKVEAEKTYAPPNSAGQPDTKNGWDYGEHGADWEGCSGSAQSPIDIVKFVDIGGQTKSVLWFDYYADPRLQNESEMALINDGHGILHQDPALDLGYVKLGAAEYETVAYEFHAPSEHTIDGQVFPLELQIMHKDPKGKLLAVGVLFKYGASNDFLAALKAAVPEMPVWDAEKGATSAVVNGTFPGVFDLEAVLPVSNIHPGKDLSFYNYPGSLTQPPCTEGVDWYVTAAPMDATKEEIQSVAKAIKAAKPTKKGNNRATQPLGSRKVLVSHTGFQHHVKQWKRNGLYAKAPLMRWKDERGYSTQDAPWAPAKAEEKEEKKEE